MPPRGGLQPLGNFTTGLRLPDGFDKRPDATGSANVQAAIAWMAEKRPPKQNHWPALVLALIAQSEALLQAEHLDNLTDVFAAHPVEVSSDGRVVNTLNFTRAGEQSIQLRPIYNAVLSVIRNDMLRQHPKNEAHATQSWPGIPSQGIMGRLAGGATVPGRALIDVLPFVEQMVLAKVSWHVGRALATGAEIPAAAAKLTISSAALRRPGMCPFPSVALPTWMCAVRAGMRSLIRGRPIQQCWWGRRRTACRPPLRGCMRRPGLPRW